MVSGFFIYKRYQISYDYDMLFGVYLQQLRRRDKYMSITIDIKGRITADNAAEYKNMFDERLAGIAAEELKESEIILNADKLEYISSAGLRVLMGIAKKVGSVSIIDASPEVCDIFAITGFDSMIKITRKLRTLSTENLELIGIGATSKVYRIDGDTVVKVYNSDFPLGRIKEEQQLNKTALHYDIPAMIAFDIVKVGECYGTVYELIGGTTLSKLMADNPDKEDEYCRLFADFLKKAHAASVPDKTVPSKKKQFYDTVEELEKCGYYTRATAEAFKGLIYFIPDANTFLHGDCHPGNVMLDEGGLSFIDMLCMAKGNPVFDIAAVCWYRVAPKVLTKDQLESIIGIQEERLEGIWRKFLKYYFETEDDTVIDRLDKQFMALECFNLSTLHYIVPGLFTKETEEWLINEGLRAADYDWSEF